MWPKESFRSGNNWKSAWSGGQGMDNVNVISTSQIHNILFSFFIICWIFLLFLTLYNFQSRITYGSKSQPQVKLAPTSDTCVVNLRFEIPQDLMVSLFCLNFDWILFWAFQRCWNFIYFHINPILLNLIGQTDWGLSEHWRKAPLLWHDVRWWTKGLANSTRRSMTFLTYMFYIVY